MKILYLLIFNFLILNSLFASPSKILGDRGSKKTWVYLSGLKKDGASESCPNEISILHAIGTNLGIKIIAIDPPERDPYFNHMLCWPHQDENALQKSHEYLTTIVPEQDIRGYIGFSNGGFFLLALAQQRSLTSPIITIGAGGNFAGKKPTNSITMLIGKEDFHHYEIAKKFYRDCFDEGALIELIEYDSGHEIPKELLSELLT